MSYGMSGPEEEEFSKLLLSKADEARRVLKYPARDFLGALEREGAYRTAVSSLARIRSEGFTDLAQAGRLDLSLEAQVVETKWRACFDPALVAMAEGKLRQQGYSIKPFGA